jgi:hypothetical protein
VLKVDIGTERTRRRSVGYFRWYKTLQLFIVHLTQKHAFGQRSKRDSRS